MLLITHWNVKPGCLKEAVQRFMAGGGKQPEGVKLLGRWHRADCSGGWTLTETESLKATYEHAAYWSDVLDVHIHPVIDDDVAAPILGDLYSSQESSRRLT